MRAKGNLVSIREIDDFVYRDLPDEKDIPLSDSNMVIISRLREKLEYVSRGQVEIETSRGLGYVLRWSNKSNE